MTEKYPSVATQQQNAYGAGILLPNPGSPILPGVTATEEKPGVPPTYEKYLGVQLPPHKYMAHAAAAAIAAGLANFTEITQDKAGNETETEVEVELVVAGDSILFRPPVPAEVARRVGSFVNHGMRQPVKKTVLPTATKEVNTLAIAY